MQLQYLVLLDGLLLQIPLQEGGQGDCSAWHPRWNLPYPGTILGCWWVFIMVVNTEGLGTDLQSVSAPSLGQVGSTLAWTCVW